MTQDAGGHPMDVTRREQVDWSSGILANGASRDDVDRGKVWLDGWPTAL